MKIELLNTCFFFLIFLLCYLLIYRMYTRRQLKKVGLISNQKVISKDVKFKNFISKINFLKTKDLFLSKQGYPLRLDSIRYYTLKILLATIFFTAGIKNYNSLIFSIILSLIGFFFIDVYISVNKKSRNLEICNDLYVVTNSVYMQLSSHMELKDSLKYQYENCKNKDFKRAMIEFSTTYELTELNIDKAVKVLKERFDIMEIEMFCNALSQYNQTRKHHRDIR